MYSLQILKLRAHVEGIAINEECLLQLAELGVKTTLR